MNKAEIIVVSILVILFNFILIQVNNLDAASCALLAVTTLLGLLLGISICTNKKR